MFNRFVIFKIENCTLFTVVRSVIILRMSIYFLSVPNALNVLSKPIKPIGVFDITLYKALMFENKIWIIGVKQNYKSYKK